MVRPCYLVVDMEHGGSISTRKLVIETAKLNVVTAYNSTEAIETLRKYSALDAAVLDAAMQDMPCGELITQLKKIRPDLPVIVVGSPREWTCDGGDHYLDTFEPARLLSLLRSLLPKEIEEIAAHDNELANTGK